MSWVVRGMLAVVAAVLGIASVAATVATVARSKSPERAHAIAPWDGRATAQLALTRFIARQEAGKPMPDPALALMALRQDAMAVPAVTMLGLRAEQEGDARRARRWFEYGEKLSRRDLLTQLWLIEDAVSRGDVVGALRHYDIALRTSRNSSDILFPILAAAIANPAIRIELRKTLSSRPPWAPLFVEYAAGSGTAPRATARLFAELARSPLQVSSLARELLVNRLASVGQYEEAWAYYTSFRPNALRRQARDPRVVADLSNPTLFDWQSVGSDGLSASIEHGMIDITVPPSTSGMLVRQLQLLPAGKYRLSGHSVGVTQPASALPYWSLQCQDGRELGRVDVPNSATANGNFTGSLVVPANCAVQTLALQARRSDSLPGLSAQFDRIALEPVG